MIRRRGNGDGEVYLIEDFYDEGTTQRNETLIYSGWSDIENFKIGKSGAVKVYF